MTLFYQQFSISQVQLTFCYWQGKRISGLSRWTHPILLMLLFQFLVSDMQLLLTLTLSINLFIGAMMRILKLRDPE